MECKRSRLNNQTYQYSIIVFLLCFSFYFLCKRMQKTNNCITTIGFGSTTKRKLIHKEIDKMKENFFSTQKEKDTEKKGRRHGKKLLCYFMQK